MNINTYLKDIVDSPKIHRYIGYFSKKLSGALPYTYDQSDAAQTLWETAIKAVHTYVEKNKTGDVVKYVERRIWSTYGDLVNKSKKSRGIFMISMWFLSQ